MRAPGFPAEAVRLLNRPDAARAADALAADPSALDVERYEAEFARATLQTLDALEEIIGYPRFVEAVSWQNLRVVETAIEPFLRRRRRGGNRDSSMRQYEELIGSYWQRYCVKNESIGFFGPIGWGQLALAEPAIVPGESLTDASTVYFENWAIQKLAERIAGGPRALAFLAPRRAAYLTIAADAVGLPGHRHVPLPAPELAILRCSDGRRRAIDIAAEVVGKGLVDGVAEVYAHLAAMVERRWVVWGPDIPVTRAPELYLRRLLDRFGDDDLRLEALAQLDRLEGRRDALHGSVGDATAVREELRRLDDTFAELTGSSPVRREGTTYGARTIVHLECRRDLRLVLGTTFLEALSPIDLVLRSGRWLTFTLRQLLDASIQETYARASTVAAPVTLSRFWFDLLRVLHGGAAQAVLDDVLREFHLRWARILNCPQNADRVRREAAELEPHVRREFDAPHAGWDGARYLSPDLLLAARGADSVRRGDFEIVLGELHLAINTLRHNLFVSHHPAPDDLWRALDSDFPEPRLLPILPKEGAPNLAGLTHPALVRDTDFLVALFHNTADPDHPRLLMSGDLQVDERDGALVVPVDDLSFDVMDVFTETMMSMLLGRFSLVEAADHTPRITIDRLVVNRESWNLAAEQLAFAGVRSESARYAAARCWWRERSLPRQVFVKSPLEAKPFYVDFDSPLLVNVLAKAVRRLLARRDAQVVKIVEMLPSVEESWLLDDAGRVYTAELRLAAIDRAPVRFRSLPRTS